MCVYYLIKDNTCPLMALKKDFIEEDFSPLKIPFSKMRKRHKKFFTKKLCESPSVFLSDSELSFLLPDYDIDPLSLFNEFLPLALKEKIKRDKITFERIILNEPTESFALTFLSHFNEFSLMGENALKTSAYISEKTRASIPIISGASPFDIVVFPDKDIKARLRVSFSEVPSPFSLGGDSLSFYIKDDTRLEKIMKRPLTLSETALLAKYDKKLSFNMLLS